MKTIVAITVLITSSSLLAAEYCDPQSDWSCYSNWCSSQGGSTYNDSRGVGCDVSGGSSGDGYNGYTDPTMIMMQSVMQKLMGDFQRGFEEGMEANRRAEEQRRRQQAEAAAAREQMQSEMEKQQLEQEKLHRDKMTQMRSDALASIRPIAGSTTLMPKDLSRSQELQVKEQTDTFGMKVLKPDMAVMTVTDNPLDLCGSELMASASLAAEQGQYQQAARLSELASEVFSGSISSAKTNCDLPEAMPDIQGTAVTANTEIDQKQQQAKTFSALYRKASQQIGDYKTLLLSIGKIDEEKKALEENITRQQQTIAEHSTLKPINLEQELEPGFTEDLKNPSPSAALRAAREALKRSEADLQTILAKEKDLFDTKISMENELKKTQQSFKLVQKPN